MPIPPSPVPLSLPTRHLYRHLLRETSYLPPAFHSHIAGLIRERFHRHRKYDTRQAKHLARARNALRTIRAANSGDKAAMNKLIMHGFGRTSVRRRQLMSRFVMSQGPDDSQALEKLMDAADEDAHEASDVKNSVVDAADKAEDGADLPVTTKRPKKIKNNFYDKWDQPKIMQLLRSQKRHQELTHRTTSWIVTGVKNLNESQFVPEQNIWGKPPAESLVRTKKAHWWRRNAEKMMPPLGSGEWDLLAKLSIGAQEEGEWKLPARRPLAKPIRVRTGADNQHWDWKPYALKPAADVERPKNVRNQRRTGQEITGPYGTRARGRDLSDRWFRRAYNRVWQVTPTMKQDPNTLQYSVAWGTPIPRVPQATKTQMGIFDGVDDKGQKLQKNKEPRR